MIAKLKQLKRANEEGFTLLELVMTFVIIAMLAAIAIPIFIGQEKAALAAGVKSDVQNTNLAIASKLSMNPTASVIGGTTAVRITQDNPYFYVGTPEGDVSPVTAGVALESKDANTRAYVSDQDTIIEIRGRWNSYTVEAKNENLSSQQQNYYLFKSETGKFVGKGDLE